MGASVARARALEAVARACDIGEGSRQNQGARALPVDEPKLRTAD